jgi:hypothetical protein
MRHVCVVALAAMAAPAFAQIVNGDFESGNTGFSSQYTYETVSVPPNVGQYGVTNSSLQWTNFWNTLNNDHTTGSGHFMIVDTLVGPTIWQETVPVAPNTAYTLSAWLATWTTFPAATLGVEVDGQLITTWTGPAGAAWTQYTAGFTSGASSSATIRLYSTTAVQPGGDVAIDDITLAPAPGCAGVLVVGALAGRRRRR